MFKSFVIGVLATVLVGIAVVLGAIFSGMAPANADARPSPLERWAARTSLHATIAREAPAGSGPLAVSDANLKAGLDVYAHDCVVCHGAADGKPSHVAQGLYQHPPQLARHGVEDDPIGVTWWKVEHGIRWTGMPSFRKSLSEDQIWQVSMFLRHMDALPPAVQQSWEQVPSAGSQ